VRNPFKLIPKSYLGIDIGVSKIKIVELSQWGGKVRLKNYGYIPSAAIYQKPYRTFDKSVFMLSTPDICKMVKGVLQEAKIETKEAVFSIPDFYTFFTNFKIPSMSNKELGDAIKFEARQHIPVPASEVALDWYIIEGELNKPEEELTVLVVAIPKEVVNRYKTIAKEAGLQVEYLEAEAFSLARLLSTHKKGVTCFLDIGAQSTTVNLIEDGVLKISHSFDISGNDFTQAISKSSASKLENAEGLKNKDGLNSQSVKKILLPLINLIIIEIDRISKEFYEVKGKNMDRIYIGGGSALLPGLDKYLADHFKKEVLVIDAFSNISFNPILDKRLKTLGPSFAVSVGAALKGLVK